MSGRAARVRDRFRDATGSHLEVLEQVLDDASVQLSRGDEVWLEDPVRGVVLVGDACHATTPSMAQGGSMAAEDALVLARELAGARGHGIDVALERYAARRQPRTRHVQETTAMRNRLAALRRRLVFENHDVEPGLVDHRTYAFCVFKQLHRARRRRDVFAVRSDQAATVPLPELHDDGSGFVNCPVGLADFEYEWAGRESNRQFYNRCG